MAEMQQDPGAGRAPDPEVAERARTRTFSARYKLDILGEYEGTALMRAPVIGVLGQQVGVLTALWGAPASPPVGFGGSALSATARSAEDVCAPQPPQWNGIQCLITRQAAGPNGIQIDPARNPLAGPTDQAGDQAETSTVLMGTSEPLDILTPATNT